MPPPMAGVPLYSPYSPSVFGTPPASSGPMMHPWSYGMLCDPYSSMVNSTNNNNASFSNIVPQMPATSLSPPTFGFESSTTNMQKPLSSFISNGNVSSSVGLFDKAPSFAPGFEPVVVAAAAAPPPPPMPTTTASSSSLHYFDLAPITSSTTNEGLKSASPPDDLFSSMALDDIWSFSSPSSSSTQISYPTTSLSTETATSASRGGSSRMRCSLRSQLKPKFEETLQISARGGKHGKIKIPMSEAQRSISDRDVRCDEMERKRNAQFNELTQDFRLQSYDDELRSDTSNIEDSKSMICKKMKKIKISKPKIKYAPTFDAPVHELLLLDVCPLSLGVEDIHGHMHTFIPRNTTIPKQTGFHPVFTNAYAYQTTATIRIFEGEHNLTKYDTFLGEFSLTGLTSNFAAQTLEIAIRVDIDANGILHVDAEEARSGAKASLTIASDHQNRLTKDQIERHLTYVESDADFAAKSVYDRKSNEPLYMLAGQTEALQNVFQQYMSLGQTTDIPLLSKLNDVRSTPTMIEELIKLQSEDGSFTLNKALADVLHIDPDIFEDLEHYLRQQGFNSLALNIRNELLRLIGTGVILIWLVVQTQTSQENKFQFLFNIEQIKVHLCNHLPTSMNEQMNKAIQFYRQTSQRNGIYCGQLQLSDHSWDVFIQHLLIDYDRIE
ncbi:unnamed protein product [Rotaria sordida]|uniref:PARP4 MVP-ID C-terminal domain-containing protein n=1 Tax=Rotaria sordida TaxID=392033 RepID=A0A814G7U2_9BILA|nr:unnamed protein product [Rotaria sordida]CAF0992955.1 unnamed protein product [Rotaria sordida]CAF3636007.1 unnamed protein product [Rotaria sordida]CAF3671471.1 unnamed protein product [Rotaria sordida]